MQPNQVRTLLSASPECSESFVPDATSLIESSSTGFWIWNVQTGETVFNEAWANIVGYSLNELKPVSIATWEKLCHPDDLRASDASLAAYWRGETKSYECETRMHHKDGDWVWVHDSGRIIRHDANGAPLIMMGTHYDITKHKREYERLASINASLKEQARTDPLTHLYNRRELENRMHELKILLQRSNIPVSLAVMDIDNFKNINDEMGHKHGDCILQCFSAACASVLSRQSDFTARTGGDEFVVVMPYTGLGNAVTLAGKISKKFKEICLCESAGDSAQAPSLSIGVASSETCPLEDLIEIADKRLYAAKKAGKNKIISSRT